MKRVIAIIFIMGLVASALAFDFTQAQVNYDAKGKAENVIMEYNNMQAVIFDLPQTKAKVKDSDVLIFTMGEGAPKKNPSGLPGTPVMWLACSADWTMDKPLSVTVTFPKDTNLDFSNAFTCYFLTEGKWEETKFTPRVEAKNRTISFWMKYLGPYAITYK
jgi:hypothetical protein